MLGYDNRYYGDTLPNRQRYFIKQVDTPTTKRLIQDERRMEKSTASLESCQSINLTIVTYFPPLTHTNFRTDKLRPASTLGCFARITRTVV